MRTLVYTIPIILLVLVFGCADENTNATFGAHPANFISTHDIDANADLGSCQLCHGIDFSGSGNAISCFTCHSSGPPFTIHPMTWVNTINDHQLFFNTDSWTSCANASCHGEDLQGGSFGPSCLSASFGGVSCHATGPSAPHAIPYQAANVHGPVARTEQIECRNCHGRPTNIFDGGFVVEVLGRNDTSGGNCSFCHSEARAHPVNWQGTNDAGGYLSTHQGVFNSACALCHKTDGPGTGPLPPAPSCFVADYQNSVSSVAVACHIGGPGIPHIVEAEWLLPSAHVAAWSANSPPCFDCHTVNSGGVDPTCRSCHTRADPTVVSSGCRSCHNDTPELLESSRQHGDHRNFTCNSCHFGFGSGSLSHWYPNPSPPSEIQLNPNDGQINFSSFSTSNCTGTCHNESHSNESW